MADDKPDDPIIKYVAERRARTGRKFETCERMKPVFAELDAAGWNDWPPTLNPDLTRKEETGTEGPDASATVTTGNEGEGGVKR